MDEVQILTQTLHATIQRAAQKAQNYEIEVVNLTAEILKLQSELEGKSAEIEALREYVNRPSTQNEVPDPS
jgi:predicted  nucleic acid-binding Zn-ribbon protein